MSRENRLPDYLERVLRNAADAGSFVEGVGKEGFLADKMTQHAVAACFFAIGGMLSRIEERYPKFFAACPEVAWLELRDECADFLENCLDIDPEKLWTVTQIYLPQLLAVLPSVDAESWAPTPKVSRAVGGVKPSAVLNRNRKAIREAAARNRTANPRVFGSVVRGEDTEESDLDLLVDDLDGTTLLDICGLQSDLEKLLGIRVDVLTPENLPEKWREQIVAEALPV